MKDYYANLRQCIDTYNMIQDKIKNHTDTTNDAEDEFLANFCIHFAHALIKDTGFGQTSRDELEKIADIINDVVR